MQPTAFFHYLSVTANDGQTASLFTIVCLPEPAGIFPVVVYRSPYVDDVSSLCEEEICSRLLASQESLLRRGCAVVFQHCRGRGKSSGDCVPYVYEREDGLALHEWIRRQPFYGGELYLCGASYTASVHYVCAPFADDIRGAVFEVQDCERYNCIYRNGFFKIGLHGGWYAGMYKYKSLQNKAYTPESFHTLPLSAFSRAVFGENAADLDAAFAHPMRTDPFWETRFGGGEAHEAVRHAAFPILFVTGFYDIYTGGVFDMWNTLDEETRARCALAVHPYDHGGSGKGQPIRFDRGSLGEAFGDYRADWIDAVRGRGPFPFAQGCVTYYRLFGDGWRTDRFPEGDRMLCFPLGDGERSYRYNPYAPASFRGGLSANFGGTQWQDKPGQRQDILSFFTPTFNADTTVQGKMRARLTVRSDCEDTCFYMRVSLCKAEGDYGLRDDIQQISNVCPNYKPGETVELDFSFDEHSFVIRAGERLRIDVSSSAFPLYVRHTNQRGLYSAQTTARIAENTVLCTQSSLWIPTTA